MQNKRPKPNKTDVKKHTRENTGTLKDVLVGLNEVPLNDIYPYLDLIETLAIASASTKLRTIYPGYFEEKLENFADIYSVLPELAEEGLAKLNSQRSTREELGTRYELVNPYNRQNLQGRLRKAIPSTTAIDKLRNALTAKPKKWVFPDQWEAEERVRNGDTSGIKVIPLERLTDKKKLVSAYAGAIAEVLGKYSTEIHPEALDALFL